MKNNKQIIFERMGIPLNEDEFGQHGISGNQYAEKAGQGQGMVNNLVSNIDEAIKYMDDILVNYSLEQCFPDLENDFENIKKRLTLGLDRMRGFGEGKEHKRKGNIKGMWGVDDDNDGLVDGSADGGFGGGDGGGE